MTARDVCYRSLPKMASKVPGVEYLSYLAASCSRSGRALDGR